MQVRLKSYILYCLLIIFSAGCSSSQKYKNWRNYPEMSTHDEIESHIQTVSQYSLENAVHTLIASAKSHILIAHFILIKDESGLDVIEHLIQRAQDGVEVKIILDGIGAYSDVPVVKKDLEELAEYGIKTQIYHPKGRNWYKLKKRMHDKILIADNFALLGSSSFWNSSFKQYQTEYDIMLKGAIVDNIHMHFRELWNSNEVYPVSINTTNKTQGAKQSRIHIKKHLLFGNLTEVKDIVYSHDSPKKTKGEGSLEDMIDFLNGASKSILIVNPYFLPVQEIKKTLLNVSKRGVKITVCTNSSDVLAREFKILGTAYASYDEYFKKSGFTIHETTTDFGMIHDKYVIVDEKRIYIGSFNFDSLSIKHNTENGVYFKSQVMQKKLYRRFNTIKPFTKLAFESGAQLRPHYKYPNALKNIWIHFLLIFTRDIM
jgi:cardiolipin synthase C